MPQYEPDPIDVPQSLEDLTSWVTRELQRIANALGQSQDKLTELTEEPKKKHEWMLVAADGLNWDPGKGKGVYIWFNNGWHWVSALGQTPAEEPQEPPEEEPEPLPDPDLEAAGRAVATFHCIGVYWKPAKPAPVGAEIQYKKSVDSVWKDAYPMWYDSRDGECRGSIVGLDAGTSYDVRFRVPGDPWEFGLRISTWNETFPEGTVTVDNPGTRTTQLNITQGGTPEAYRVFSGNNLATTIQLGEAAACIEVRASYVIIKGYNLRGGEHAIRIWPDVHDVVIERNNISDWSARRDEQDGVVRSRKGNAAVFCNTVQGSGPQPNLKRIIVQRNTIHDPKYGANSWVTGHPAGPFAMFLYETGGNHVFRYNTVYSTTRMKWFQDIVGGGENFSNLGAPGPDCDIYGNILQSCFDDTVSAEGGNPNVRIWGNYCDGYGAAAIIACSVTHRGPLYVWRNVVNRCMVRPSLGESSPRGVFGKARDVGAFGGGRRYFFHNTLLQPPSELGGTRPWGCGDGIVGGLDQPLTNTVTRNNTLHVVSDTSRSIATLGGTDNDCNYDLYNGTLSGQSGMEVNGIRSRPTYKAGHGVEATNGYTPVVPLGKYQLAVGSPGHDDGQVLANFNDGFLGVAPDMGAHEEGSADMVFGPNS